MLFESLSGSEQGIHIEQFVFLLEGSLDKDSFLKAWEKVVEHNSILRECFVWKNQEEPLQVVLPGVKLPVQWESWGNLSQDEESKRLEALLAKDRKEGFSLSKAPLMRILVITRNEKSHRLVLTAHHLLLDGWSLILVLKQFFTCYQAFCEKKIFTLPFTPPYRSYIAWLKQQNLAEAEMFWHKTLQGFSEPTALGKKSELPLEWLGESPYQEKMVSFSSDITARWNQLARQNQWTPNTFFQAVWALLLHCYSGKDDVVFGITVSGRPSEIAGISDMIGLFINTLPLRVQRKKETLLLSWLKEIQDKNLALREYQYCTTGQVHKWSDMPGALALYESILVFENYPVETPVMEGSGLKTNIHQVYSKGAQTRYAVTLLVTMAQETKCKFIYDCRRISRESMERIASHFSALLESIDQAHLESSLESLSRLVPQEQIPEIHPHGKPSQEKQDKLAVPENAYQKKVAEIWAEVLGVSAVGIHDNFFAMGGHSLLAAQLISRLSESFQIKLPLVCLFEGPTVAQLALSIEKRDKQSKAKQEDKTPNILCNQEDRYKPFPLTDVQEAYWIGRTGAFDLGNVSTHGYFEIEAQNLDIARLNKAWQRLVEHHDMLRAIILPDGQQQVLEKVSFYAFETLDLRSHKEEQAIIELEKIRSRMSHQVLPLNQWPMFEIRATLLSNNTTRIHISLDAMILDAWSFNLLSKQWQELYQDIDKILPEFKITFRDYVLAERNLADSEPYRMSKEYWDKRLPSLPAAPDLPVVDSFDFHATPVFERHQDRLDPETWSNLKNKAGKKGLSPSGLLLSAYSQILATWSKNPHFMINVSLFHRLPLHPQIQDVIGDFTSLTLLEVKSQGSSFLENARAIQQQLWQDLDHSHISGIKIMRELGRIQGRNTGAVMPVVFTSDLTQPVEQRKSSSFSWMGKGIYSITQTPQVWLDHQIIEEEGSLVFQWDSVKGIFMSGVLDAMFQAYCNLLHRLSEDDGVWENTKRESLIPRQQLEIIESHNRTDAPIPQGLLHSPFLNQVVPRYLQNAVVTSKKSLSYKELYLRSLQIANLLKDARVRPNTLVGVVMEKGWEQIVAVLGILQAGAAYLPIDAHLPQKRIHYLLEDGKVQIALTQSYLESTIEWPENVKHIAVDKQEVAPGGRALDPIQKPEDLAYVIYTSGSTGMPKGVMIDHRGALNTVCDINSRYNIKPEDKVLALSLLSFDLSVYDIFGILGAGGTIVIPDANALRDPSHWASLMIKEKVTVWNTVPALMEMLIEHLSGKSERLSFFPRLVMMSGDWIPVNLPDRIKAQSPTCQIISLGGATEVSIWSILYPIEKVEPDWKSIPYGHAMINQKFYVMNQSLEIRPVWVPGDLYIGGIGLAKGYWGNKEKTEAAFIVNPHTKERLYRTGDLGRYLPDGNIEFLGREDFQVKIRGHRIELGEIETALSQHPGIRSCVVDAIGEKTNRRLVAYIVKQQQHQADLTESGERWKFKAQQKNFRKIQAEQYTVDLQRPSQDSLLQERIQRRTFRSFIREAIPMQKFSEFLSCLMSLEIEGIRKYRYGSAGGLYPVQTYLYIKPGRIEGILGGIYYYDPKEHRLALLQENPKIYAYIHFPGNQEMFIESAFSIFLIGYQHAIEPMYGEKSLHYSILEAGIMSQLMEEAAIHQEIGLCQVGEFHFDKIQELFELEEGHILLHSLVGGKIAPEQKNSYSPIQEMQTIQSTKQKESISREDKALSEDLQNFLRDKLPAYMVPSAFVVMEELPLNSNGKVNRKALPEPQISSTQEKTSLVPVSEMEQSIASVWKEVLKVDKVGVDDSFFDLGGTSLHMIQVHSKLVKKLNRDIPIVEMFFQHSTIAALSKHLTETTPKNDSPDSPHADASKMKSMRDRRKRSRE